MQITIIPVTSFAQNCSIIVCEATGKAAVVDPGGDIERILGKCAEIGASLEKILVTHGHIDHVGGVSELSTRLHLPIEGPHPDDRFWIDGMAMQSQYFGFPSVPTFTPDRWLQQGDAVTVGTTELQVRHCPGHTPGHIVFFDPQSRWAFVGDVLFKGSIGRTDFPQGDHRQLLQSIRNQLWTLGDDVQFVPGHGPTSSIGHERLTNPYLQA